MLILCKYKKYFTVILSAIWDRLTQIRSAELSFADIHQIERKVVNIFITVGNYRNSEIRSTTIGRFQKISIPYHGRLLGFPKGRGGSRLWNSEGMGG